MSVTSHVNELRRKHQTLEQKIQSEQRSAAADQVEITRLKREKLRLKDEISRLSSV